MAKRNIIPDALEYEAAQMYASCFYGRLWIVVQISVTDGVSTERTLFRVESFGANSAITEHMNFAEAAKVYNEL